MFDPDPKLDRALRKLLHPQLKTIDPSLDRILRLLDHLGNPQNHLPPVIHIAGTNGKGSTLAFLRSILTAAGYRVHSYTSPHLVRFNERIRLGEQDISTEMLTPILEQILSLQDEFPTTFFEATTVAAFLAFREVEADFILLETGMGGRLDATNVIAQPAATVITPIGVDHAFYLGDSLAQIAGEKAGIIKPEVTAIVSHQPPEVMDVISHKAAACKAPIHLGGEHWSYRKNDEIHWGFEGRKHYDHLPFPSLLGDYQLSNAATALATLESISGLALSEKQIHKGLTGAHWPARLQPLTSGYWRDLLPKEGFSLYLDGGHNPMAAQHQAQWLQSSANGKPVYLVLGMLKDKDAAGFLAPFHSLSPELFTVTPDAEAPVHSAEALAELGKKAEFCAQEVASLEKALNLIANRPPGVVLMTGSLYIAAMVLAKN